MGKHDRRNSAKMKRKKSQAKKKSRDKRKRTTPKAGAATAKKTSRKASASPPAAATCPVAETSEVPATEEGWCCRFSPRAPLTIVRGVMMREGRGQIRRSPVGSFESRAPLAR